MCKNTHTRDSFMMQVQSQGVLNKKSCKTPDVMDFGRARVVALGMPCGLNELLGRCHLKTALGGQPLTMPPTHGTTAILNRGQVSI